MDDLSFDHLVKRLSETRTRRTSLRALAGGTLAAVTLADVSTQARNRKKKQKCKPPKVKCGRKRCCAAGQRCVDGACVTPPSVCTPPCSAGLQCVAVACVCDATLCSALTNPNPGQTSCSCREDFNGQLLCIASQQCAAPIDCGPDGTCPSGFVCEKFGCGIKPTCVKTCV